MWNFYYVIFTNYTVIAVTRYLEWLSRLISFPGRAWKYHILRSGHLFFMTEEAKYYYWRQQLFRRIEARSPETMKI